VLAALLLALLTFSPAFVAAAAAAVLSAAAHMPELRACLKSGWLGGMCTMAHSAMKMAVQPTAFTW
jgi:hypothetical protein